VKTASAVPLPMNLRWLPWTVLVVATGAAALLLFRPPRVPTSAEDVLTRPPDPMPKAPSELEAPKLATGPRPEARAKEPIGPRGSVDWRSIPKGPIEVAVLGADDVLLPLEAVRVDVGPAPGQREWATRPCAWTSARLRGSASGPRPPR
jgi:hypothetical protein